MPDFDTHYYWHCTTAENWTTTVPGSKGAKYTVRWDKHSHKNFREVHYDWSCDCKAYQMRPGYCKHIEQVKARSLNEGGRCGWMQFTDNGEPDSNGRCPNCHEEIHSMGWAV